MQTDFSLEVCMRKNMSLMFLGVLVYVSSLAAQQGNAVQTAAGALGAGRIKTLQFTGSGANFSVGQNYTPNEPWPRVTVKNYTASINYDTGSMRLELLREMGDVMPRGGGAPFFGEQRQVQVVSGNYAWNVPAPAGSAPAASAGSGSGRTARADARHVGHASRIRESGDDE